MDQNTLNVSFGTWPVAAGIAAVVFVFGFIMALLATDSKSRAFPIVLGVLTALSAITFLAMGYLPALLLICGAQAGVTWIVAYQTAFNRRPYIRSFHDQGHSMEGWGCGGPGGYGR